jgi:hypothetical protein
MKSIKISLVINILVVLMTIFASVVMFTGFRFMTGYEPYLESTKIGMFRFFTVDSNILMGIVSLLFAIKEIQLLKGKIEEIPFKYYILKIISTSAVGLTTFVVFAYLGPISKYGTVSLLMNSNLFFHLIIPVVSILNFVLFEKTDKIKFRHTFYGILGTVAYEVYYIINVLVHMENGKVSYVYDWYWFVQNGVWTAVIVAPLIILITYILTLIIWRLNKIRLKKNDDENEEVKKKNKKANQLVTIFIVTFLIILSIFFILKHLYNTSILVIHPSEFYKLFGSSYYYDVSKLGIVKNNSLGVEYDEEIRFLNIVDFVDLHILKNQLQEGETSKEMSGKGWFENRENYVYVDGIRYYEKDNQEVFDKILEIVGKYFK